MDRGYSVQCLHVLILIIKNHNCMRRRKHIGLQIKKNVTQVRYASIG